MNLTEIARSWWQWAKASPQDQQMIEFRLSVCDRCPSKAQLSPLGKKLLKALNEEANVFYCMECGCPLAGKTAHPDNRCPLGKWSNLKPTQ